MITLKFTDSKTLSGMEVDFDSMAEMTKFLEGFVTVSRDFIDFIELMKAIGRYMQKRNGDPKLSGGAGEAIVAEWNRPDRKKPNGEHPEKTPD